MSFSLLASDYKDHPPQTELLCSNFRLFKAGKKKVDNIL